MLNETFDIEVGEVLVCSKYLKLTGGKRSDNFEYTVKAVNNDAFSIEDLSGNRAFEFKLDLIRTHFIQSYCRTCHSFQGSCIEGKTAILIGASSSLTASGFTPRSPCATELRSTVFVDGQAEEYDEKTLDRYLTRKVENTESKTSTTEEPWPATSSPKPD